VLSLTSDHTFLSPGPHSLEDEVSMRNRSSDSHTLEVLGEVSVVMSGGEVNHLQSQR
jgi:hypothetical protein